MAAHQSQNTLCGTFEVRSRPAELTSVAKKKQHLDGFNSASSLADWRCLTRPIGGKVALVALHTSRAHPCWKQQKMSQTDDVFWWNLCFYLFFFIYPFSILIFWFSFSLRQVPAYSSAPPAGGGVSVTVFLPTVQFFFLGFQCSFYCADFSFAFLLLFFKAFGCDLLLHK